MWFEHRLRDEMRIYDDDMTNWRSEFQKLFFCKCSRRKFFFLLSLRNEEIAQIKRMKEHSLYPELNDGDPR